MIDWTRNEPHITTQINNTFQMCSYQVSFHFTSDLESPVLMSFKVYINKIKLLINLLVLYLKSPPYVCYFK